MFAATELGLCQHPTMISRLQSNQLCQCIHVISFYKVESLTPQVSFLCSLGFGKMCLLLLGSLRHIYSLGQTYLYSIHCFSSSFVYVFNLCYMTARGLTLPELFQVRCKKTHVVWIWLCGIALKWYLMSLTKRNSYLHAKPLSEKS